MPALALAELSAPERRQLARLHPQIRADRPALVVSMETADDARLEALVEAIQKVAGILSRTEEKELGRERAEMERAIEALTPDLSVLAPAAVLQARRNAAARTALAREHGLLTSAQVADLAGSRARNRAALAHRWTAEGRVFAVTHAGARYWPGFQLDGEGRPLPVIAEIVSVFGEQVQGWEAALWLTAANGALGGRRPVDLLTEEPDAVVAAARREVEELVF
jgi:hypothetical protein